MCLVSHSGLVAVLMTRATLFDIYMYSEVTENNNKLQRRERTNTGNGTALSAINNCTRAFSRVDNLAPIEERR